MFSDIYWKNEHRLECSSEVCTATERDRYEKSVSISSHFGNRVKAYFFVHTCIIIRYEQKHRFNSNIKCNHLRIEINCFRFIEYIYIIETLGIFDLLYEACICSFPKMSELSILTSLLVCQIYKAQRNVVLCAAGILLYWYMINYHTTSHFTFM